MISYSFTETILTKILTAEACKNGLPTIADLLLDPFFSGVKLKLLATDKAHLKIPSSAKEHLKIIITKIEERLKDEQKMVRSQKRLARVQEMMSSEEEKKKHRHKLVRNIFQSTCKITDDNIEMVYVTHKYVTLIWFLLFN